MEYIYDKADCRFNNDDLASAADWFEEHLKKLSNWIFINQSRN